MTILAAVVLGFVWLFQVAFLSQSYLKNRSAQMANQGRIVSTQIAETGIVRIDANILAELTKLEDTLNAKIEIFSADGNTVYSTAVSGMMGGQGSGAGAGMMGGRVDLSAAFAGNTFSETIVHPRWGSQLVVAVPILSGGKVIGVTAVYTPSAAITEAVGVLQKQLMVITPISLLLAGLLAFVVSRIFTGPIRRIDETAKKIAGGDYSAKLEIKSKDELGMLAGTINDLSEQLQKIEALRRDFIANVSHEFKTPLSIIKGYTELISDTLSPEELEQNRESLYIISDETDKMDRMAKDILQLSELQAGLANLHPSETDLCAMAEEAVRKHGALAVKRGIALGLEGCSGSAPVRCDAEKIWQVLDNFIVNAIRHTAENGKITIRVDRSKENETMLSVIDNGTGIDPEDLPFVWDRFYRGDRSRNRGDGGSGLGMSIAKGILEAHGSRFGVDSALGGGTTVWFTLKNTSR
jgi:signal transduction histidine kinase